MINRKMLKSVCLLTILVLFSFQTNTISAQEGCNGSMSIPTSPGDADYSNMICECSGVTPCIVEGDSGVTIVPGSSVALTVEEGCHPFTWQVSGTGYTLTSEVTTGRTNNLTCTGGT
ncbi:MAG: hypothetical protein JRJ00_13070 [Deltaproteobacteria bacterium]|nr:hypothetical protein [Deltaproteobacteria bacterium]